MRENVCKALTNWKRVDVLVVCKFKRQNWIHFLFSRSRDVCRLQIHNTNLANWRNEFVVKWACFCLLWSNLVFGSSEIHLIEESSFAARCSVNSETRVSWCEQSPLDRNWLIKSNSTVIVFPKQEATTMITIPGTITISCSNNKQTLSLSLSRSRSLFSLKFGSAHKTGRWS